METSTTSTEGWLVETSNRRNADTPSWKGVALMHKKTILALGGATLALAVASPAALGAGTQVTVRVEGKKKTLLHTDMVRTHGGFITSNGAPARACSANSGAGALDVATDHRWKATWSTSFSDFLIKSILGDTESTSKFYWGIWINNRYATSGACGLKLHRGDQLLFAVDSVAHHEHPLAIQAPKQVQSGKPFNVKVVYFTDSGKSKPAAGVRLTGVGKAPVTNKHGIARLRISGFGTLAMGAVGKGFIRAEFVGLPVCRGSLCA